MRPSSIAAALALAGAAWAQTAVSPEDLAALEALKAKTGAAQPVLRADELAELEAHRARIAAAEAAAEPRPWSLRIVVPDEEGDGYELALTLDLSPPQLLLVPAAGRKAGDVIEAAGKIDSVAKFQGAHRPVLTPLGTPARRDRDGASPPASVTDALTSSGPDSSGGVQVSNVLFTFFAVVALAVVLLRIKSRIDARKSRGRRR